MTPWKAVEVAQGMARKLGIPCSHVEDIQWAEGYADGREAPKGIAYGNWNDDDSYDRVKRERVKSPGKIMSRLCNILERMGVQIEWSDTVSTCDSCGLLIETHPNSYGWRPRYVETDDGLTCAKCLEGDEENYLETLEGDARRSCIETIDPSEHGYVKIAEDLQRGFHSGQDADPRVIAKALRAKGVSRFLFQVDDVGQFDATFSVYVHTEEANKVTELTPAETDGPSVSEAMKRGLQAAAQQSSVLERSGGVVYSQINEDGTANTRVISRDEFIEKGIR
jgi:hypothetical protein